MDSWRWFLSVKGGHANAGAATRVWLMAAVGGDVMRGRKISDARGLSEMANDIRFSMTYNAKRADISPRGNTIASQDHAGAAVNTISRGAWLVVMMVHGHSWFDRQ
jgi:hypothetical protein